MAADIRRVLDIRQSGTNFTYLDTSAKRQVTRKDTRNLFVGVRAPPFTLISESGVYKLIIRQHPVSTAGDGCFDQAA